MNRTEKKQLAKLISVVSISLLVSQPTYLIGFEEPQTEQTNTIEPQVISEQATPEQAMPEQTLCVPQPILTEQNTPDTPPDLAPEPASSDESCTTQDEADSPSLEIELETDNRFELDSADLIVERPKWQQRLQTAGTAVFIKMLEAKEYAETKYDQLKMWWRKKATKPCKK